MEGFIAAFGDWGWLWWLFGIGLGLSVRAVVMIVLDEM